MKLATITVMSVLALAYVMNQSAQTLTIGNWIAGAGGVLAFFSSIIGWLGVAVTGSDTSSNSLFGVLQQQAATKAGIDPLLLTAGNCSGGVLGKMVSPQNLAIGAAAVGLAGREGDLFRKVIGWSLLMLLIMCILVYLQSTVGARMDDPVDLTRPRRRAAPRSSATTGSTRPSTSCGPTSPTACSSTT